MYGLPKDTDLSFLLGNNEVNQICIGPYDAIIRCYEVVAFSIEGDFILNRNDGQSIKVKRGEYPLSAGCLSHVVGTSVVAYEIQDKGTLMLEFSNGDQLFLLEDSSPYESYNISTPHRTIIV